MPELSLAAMRARSVELFPGLLLAFTIAGAAKFLSEHYSAPVMLFALLIGMAFNFLAVDIRCKPGIEFASSALLRAGIVLLGVRITLGDVLSIGISGLTAVLILMALTVFSGFVFARLFGRGWRFALLTGGSVAVCGASAAMAIATVIPHNEKTQRNILFTVVSVTTLSTVAMIVYPIVFSIAGLTDSQSGFLIGATVHDVAQVIGAGYSISTQAGDVATIVKLLRVSMLPVVLVLIVLTVSTTGNNRGSFRLPGFVVGFAAVAAINSFILIPAILADSIAALSSWFLVIAIAALGVKTSMKAMLELGWRHVAVIVLETLVLLAAAFVAVESGWISASH